MQMIAKQIAVATLATVSANAIENATSFILS